MALKNAAGNAAPAADASSKFEEEEATTSAPVAAVAEKPAATVGTSDVAGAAAATNTAITKAAATSLVASGKPILALLEDKRDAMPRLEFGTLPRVVANAGQFQDRGTSQMLGDELKVEVISFNKEFVVSPGSDEADAKELVRYSADGKTLEETGQSVAEYLEYLRVTEEYPNAKVKEYTQVIAILNGAQKGGKPVASELVGKMVLISMSPSSRKNFDGFRIQEAVFVRMGKRTVEGAENIVLRTDAKTKGSDSYTVIKVDKE